MTRAIGLALLALCGCDAAVDICGDDAVPVCGADNVLYGDYCAAGAAGVEVIAVGGCPCEPVTCEIDCEFGFATGANGCEECRCNDGPVDAGTDAGRDGGMTTDAAVPDAGEDAAVPDAGSDAGPDAPIVCPADQLLCEGRCVPQSTSRCGGCDIACAEGPHARAACIEGSCALACEDGYYDCVEAMDGCETPASTSNCGACGTNCSPPLVGPGVAACAPNPGDPSRYDCTIECGDGFEPCDGSCIDTASDPEHCGGCAMPCARSAACHRGMCTGEEFCDNPENWDSRGGSCTFSCGRYTLQVGPTSATCLRPDGGAHMCPVDDGDCGPNPECCGPLAG